MSTEKKMRRPRLEIAEDLEACLGVRRSITLQRIALFLRRAKRLFRQRKARRVFGGGLALFAAQFLVWLF